MSRERLCWVTEGTDRDPALVEGWALAVFGPGLSRLAVASFASTVRGGRPAWRRGRVPVALLSDVVRARLSDGVEELDVTLAGRPWWTPTGDVVEVDGTSVPEMERRGSQIDVVFRTGEVDVDGLEADLEAMLPASVIARRDGTTARAVASPIGLLLVPRREIRTPDVDWPVFEAPPFSEVEPEVPPSA